MARGDVSTFFNMSDADVFGYVTRQGLATIFDPCDARRNASQGLWPGPDMTPEQLKGGLQTLRSVVCSDTYGGVDAVRWARDTYNPRIGGQIKWGIKLGWVVSLVS